MPITVLPKDKARCPHSRQHPLKTEARWGPNLATPTLNHGVLAPWQAPTIPLFSPFEVKRGPPRGSGLWGREWAATPLHPAVPNLCAVLAQVPEGTPWVAVLDLLLCALNTDPQVCSSNGTQEEPGTALPQGFREALMCVNALRHLCLEVRAILQLVADLLTCRPAKEDSDENTIQILDFSGVPGYKVSPTKAQISK